jgi:hypothetical protein
MSQNYSDLFAQLEQLSALELHRQAQSLVRAESETTAALITRIATISKKDAHLELRYKNLFDYCVNGLHLSEGSTYLRIQVANVCKEFPMVLEYLSQNRISLTVAGLLSPHLRPENAEKLLQDCEHMSKRKVEEYLVSIKPKPQVSSGIRRAATPLPFQNGEEQSSLGSSVGSTQPEIDTSSTSKPVASTNATPAPDPSTPIAETPEAKPATSRMNPASPETYNFRFSAGKVFKDKLERLAEVLGIERPESRLQEVLEQAIDLALDRKDPQRKLERKLKRENSRASLSHRPAEDGVATTPASPEGCAVTPPASHEVRAGSGAETANHPPVPSKTCDALPNSIPAPVIHLSFQSLNGDSVAFGLDKNAEVGKVQGISENAAIPQKPRSRYIPAAIRALVLQRAGYQCEYRGPDGHRCESRTGLAIDHIWPYAFWGSGDEKNLQALCPNHNLWKAERDFGKEFIRRKIADSG